MKKHSFNFIFSSSCFCTIWQFRQQHFKYHKKQLFSKAENDIAIRNALTNNDIRNLALTDVVGKETHDFKYKVKVKGITDQKSSGRCWMFTGLNILRPQLIDEKNIKF